jgi:hypothetical protein
MNNYKHSQERAYRSVFQDHAFYEKGIKEQEENEKLVDRFMAELVTDIVSADNDYITIKFLIKSLGLVFFFKTDMHQIRLLPEYKSGGLDGALKYLSYRYMNKIRTEIASDI